MIAFLNNPASPCVCLRPALDPYGAPISGVGSLKLVPLHGHVSVANQDLQAIKGEESRRNFQKTLILKREKHFPQLMSQVARRR